jgi:aminoglycoside phosphotransferase (APT) family kinase protein
MQLPEIERLCGAAVPGAGTIEIKRLGAGLLSETYRVSRDGVAYTLKVAAEHPPDLGVDLPWEVRVLERAASAGVAPRLVFHDLTGAVQLSRWVPGHSWVSRESAVPANLERIAALLRRVHALAVPLPARSVTPLQWMGIYDEALLRRTSAASDPELRKAALTRAQALELPGAAGVVCHSDLHAMNLIEEDDSLILLDWEYAHVTDPLWDLAGWSANNDFDAEIQRDLLTRYSGSAPNLSQWQRFRSLLALYDYVCLLWSQLYLTVRDTAADGVAERARLLDARLRLPAHYAA